MVDIKKIECFSGKLGKKILLEAYTSEDDENTVITATSLKNIFESIKDEFGITDSINSDVRVSADGNITYASVEWTLKDRNGYNSTFIGEATPASLVTTIAKQYPKLTAYNRALSMGIKAYLQIPKNIYTNDEIPIETSKSNKVGMENIPLNLISEDKSVNKQMVTSFPIKKTTSATSIAAKLANTEPKSDMIGSIKSAPVFTESEVGLDSIYTDNLERNIVTIKEDQSEINEINSEASEIKTDEESVVNDDSIVPIGVFAGKTVRELFEEDTPVVRSFIQMCTLHQIKDPDKNKMAILDYIGQKAQIDK